MVLLLFFVGKVAKEEKINKLKQIFNKIDVILARKGKTLFNITKSIKQ